MFIVDHPEEASVSTKINSQNASSFRNIVHSLAGGVNKTSDNTTIPDDNAPLNNGESLQATAAVSVDNTAYIFDNVFINPTY